MKILFISENYPPYIAGGAEISTSLLAGWLAQHNTVSVACSAFTAEPWNEDGVTAYPIIKRVSVGAKSVYASLKYAIDIVRAPIVSAFQVMRLIKKLDPDVVNIVVTVYYYIPIVLLVKLFYRRQIFIDCRDYSLVCPIGFKGKEIEDPQRRHHGYRCFLEVYQVDNKFLRLFMVPFSLYESFVFNVYKSLIRREINYGNGLTLVPLSRYVQQQLILNGFREDKTVVIPNISRRIEKTVHIQKASIPTFAYGGRIEKEKGIWDLVAAVELLQKETSHQFLVKIAGNGSAYHALKTYLEKNPSIPVELLGIIKPLQVLELYQESLAIVAPSRWPEPFGRFIQEAISVGTPVIATAAGGITEGVQNGVTGLLVEVGNIRQLADAMKHFIDHPGDSHTMGAAIMREKDRYDADVIGNKRLVLYQNKIKRPLKILQITSTGYLAGGAPVIVLTLRDELRKRGHQVKVLSSDAEGEGMFSDYRMKLIPKNSPLKALDHLFYLRSYFLTRKVIKEFCPDIIHLHNIDAFSPSVLFAIGSTPAVMTIHGPEEFTKDLLPWVLLPTDYRKELFDLQDLTSVGHLRYWYYLSFQRPIYQLGFRHVKKFIAPSKYMASAIREDVSQKKITQIYNGIHLPSYKPLPKNDRVLYVGRLEDVKGVDALIRAFALVKKKIAAAELRIVGDGYARQDLERLAAELGVDKSVKFCGWVSAGEAVIHEYENASVIAIPSVWPENLPTVCIEALAVGRPIVGTRTGGIPELVDEGKTGHIVPINDVDAMGNALIGLLGNRASLEKMSKAAHESAKNFDVSRFVTEIEALYQGVASAQQQG